MLQLSWERRQAERAAAAARDAARELEIEAHRQRLIRGRTRAERIMACNAMRVLIKSRTREQVWRLAIERGIAR